MLKLKVIKYMLYLKVWKYIPTLNEIYIYIYILANVSLLIPYWVNVSHSPSKAMMKL